MAVASGSVSCFLLVLVWCLAWGFSQKNEKMKRSCHAASELNGTKWVQKVQLRPVLNFECNDCERR
jgi:hypothetical protein